ncbi:MAG: hypothetical protein K8S94_03375 [Planctomycetia bacterium]|nr:hypothetical protein [Planctomycetia bacterium]
MKFTMPTLILLALSMPTVWGDDAPQPKTGVGDVSVQVQVLEGAGGATKIEGAGGEAKAFVIRIGPDGKVEFKNALPPDVEKKVQEARGDDPSKEEATQGDKGPGTVVKGMDVRGSISVVGPSGVIYSQKFGAAGEAAPDVEQLLEQSLKAAGADLPENVRQALKHAFQQPEQASGTQPAGEATDIASKLDRILARLEKIEQQIGQLRAAENSKNE